jgi:uncharacterized membrane protein YsdA (DUF1294 family)/cold shock CspA family protein
MRLEGRITNWKDDKGFGFITPACGGDQVFVHIKTFVDRDKRPATNDVVTYELVFDTQKRARAAKVAFAHRRLTPRYPHGHGTRKPSAPPDRLVVPTFVSLAFFALLVWLAITRKLHVLVPVIVALTSLLAFFMYGADKSRAERGAQRTPETSLHFIAIAGGWPGAWIAQRVFRHKSKKAEFQTAFRLTVIANCAVLVLLAFPAVRAFLHDLMLRIPH